MDFKSFSFPRTQFPRFDNSCAKSIELQKRYDNLMREGKYLQEKRNVTIVLCKRKWDTQFPVDIICLISETSCSSNVQKGNIFDSSHIEAFSKNLKQRYESVCVFIVDSKEKTKISHLLGDNIHVIEINDDAKIKVEDMYHSKMNVMIATKENLKREIDNLLERISLAPLKPICEHCYAMFKEKTSRIMDKNVPRYALERNVLANGVGQRHQSSLPSVEKLSTLQVSNTTSQYINRSEIFADTSGQPNTDPNISKHKQEVTTSDVPCKTITTIYKRTRSHFTPDDMVKCYSGSNLNGYKNSKDDAQPALRKSSTEQASKIPIENNEFKKDRRKADILWQTSSEDHLNKEDPERLLEAILAVYGMSNVPESERPNVPKQSKKINEQMKEELFMICPTIKRMGYRYRTFHIYAVQPIKQEDEQARKNKIRAIMNKYKIFSYKIVHCKEEIQELMYTGAKIKARSKPEDSKDGTLGCFVKTNEENRHFCILSKHVTLNCKEIFYVENGNNKFLGDMIPQTNTRVHGSLDISAALMKDPVDEESTKFKDTRGTPLRGRLHEYNDEDEDDICRSGQSVHIHGAITKPGIGEITMPIVHYGLTSPLIQVEDIGGDGAAHFADTGDSGVVVCVEDPERKHVHALGMVMGIDLSNDSPRRKYLAIPLSKGIQQIAEQTNNCLELM